MRLHRDPLGALDLDALDGALSCRLCGGPIDPDAHELTYTDLGWSPHAYANLDEARLLERLELERAEYGDQRFGGWVCAPCWQEISQ